MPLRGRGKGLTVGARSCRVSAAVGWAGAHGGARSMTCPRGGVPRIPTQGGSHRRPGSKRRRRERAWCPVRGVRDLNEVRPRPGNAGNEHGRTGSGRMCVGDPTTGRMRSTTVCACAPCTTSFSTRASWVLGRGAAYPSHSASSDAARQAASTCWRWPDGRSRPAGRGSTGRRPAPAVARRTGLPRRTRGARRPGAVSADQPRRPCATSICSTCWPATRFRSLARVSGSVEYTTVPIMPRVRSTL